ncbi:MAG: CotH kinase family protein [Saprospiraceae bacterium]
MNLAKAMGFFLTFLCYTTTLTSQSIFINEFMASNETTIADENGEADDWVEIYNAGILPFNIGGKFVTDDLSEPNQWQIPTTNPTLTTIPAGGYLILWFDGDEDQGVLHVSPKLGGGGEQIGIYDTDGPPLDTLTYGEQSQDISAGRFPNGSFIFVKFAAPTPGTANSEPAPEEVVIPRASQAGGLYNTPISLTIETVTENAVIYYTTDGSDPDENSSLYNEPIIINTSQVIRAKGFKIGATASEIITNTYLVNTNHTFPVVALSGNPEKFFGEAEGLFPNFEEDIEVPLNVEFYETDGTQGFNQVVEVELQGTGSASLPQKSLAMKAKGSLGSATIDYAVFPNEDLDEYRSLTLRNSGQDWEYTLFRDALESDLVANLSDLEVEIEAPNLDDQAYRPAIAYLNGAYWGIYNLRERSDKRYIRNRYGLKDDEIDLLENLEEAKEGDFEAWNNLDSLLRAKTFIDDAGLNELANLADLDNYMDYIIHNVFLDNTDWPGNNYLRWRERSSDGKWRWMTKDLDYGFGFLELDTENFNTGNPNVNSLDRILNPTFFFPNPDWATILFNRLMENPVWKTRFINRMADQLNVLFPKNRLLDKINTFQARYQPEIGQHNQKWQNVWTWNQDIDILRQFAEGRTEAVRGHFVESIPEVEGTARVALNTLPANGGRIKINTVTTNPNGTPWIGVYFEGVDIPMEAIANDGFKFMGWSANVNSIATNTTINLAGDISITAIFVSDGDSTNTPLNQVINFPTIADKTTTATPFEVNVSASSSLPVALSIISGPATLSGNTVTLNGETGTVFIQASQAGNAQYNAATTVSHFFEVEEDTIINPPTTTGYCEAKGNQPWQEYIATVQFNGIDNTSEKDGYSDFLSQSATINQGERYPISLTPGFSWAHHEEHFTVWIDWNQDGDFTDTAELVYTAIFTIGESGTPATPIVGLITVPNTALLGTTRMRISMQRNNAAESCETFALGEVEDYSLIIMEAEEAGTSLTVDCPAAIVLTTEADEFGAIAAWDIPTVTTDCPNGINTIIQTNGLPDGSFFPVGSSPVNYTITDSCGNSTTCELEIKVIESGTYCAAIGNQPWLEYIKNVSLNTIDNTSFKERYEDFTNISTVLETGQDYEISLSPDFSFFQWNEAFQVWIDLDGNGSFDDAGELVFAGMYPAQARGTIPAPITGNIIIPNNVNPITTRMRVVMQRETPAAACDDFELGEVEDYTIEIIRGDNGRSRNRYLNFAAFNIGRAVELQWLTNTIDESKRFVVERSADGETFEPLKSIHQFSDKNKDAFFKEVDQQPLIGTNYYRLKQVLTDGQTTFSPIQAVNFQIDLEKLVIFPNPAQEALNIQLPNLMGQALSIQLFDTFGQLYKSLEIDTVSEDLVTIPISNFANGLYYLQISAGHQKMINRKVIINRLY